MHERHRNQILLFHLRFAFRRSTIDSLVFGCDECRRIICESTFVLRASIVHIILQRALPSVVRMPLSVIDAAGFFCAARRFLLRHYVITVSQHLVLRARFACRRSAIDASPWMR
jgi:hypothetical protein